ncbi:MAG: dihydroorotase [Candidatus Cloacimonetes bacterium HGW-Cloacimonetes-1]|jgi:dihydroorotase|nr:MAG: dihydroorotase [Candidatus Cloacimonetes bacterium HGW-Cloacimonetes-1]
MKTLIKNGTVYIDGAFCARDILIEDEIISQVSDSIEAIADVTVDASGKHIFPGFVDLHAHLRDPGQTYKEDIVTGTRAAAKGGFTTVCAMPNTEPVIDNIAAVEYIQRRAKDLGFCKVRVIGAITKQSEGKEISEMATMKSGGIIGVSDDGKCVQNARLMLNCMKYAVNYDLPVIIHAEDYNLAGKGQIHAGRIASKTGLSGIPAIAEEVIIARDIMLAESTKARLHVAHVSTAKSLELIRDAQNRGIQVTCEVTPHHLLLNEEATQTFDPNTKMKPPLRSEQDRLALVEGLKSGLISCIATDHAPHADYEKEREFDHAPFGIIGFETAFAVLYHHLVRAGLISLERLIEAMAIAPANIMKLYQPGIIEGNKADLVIADLDAKILVNVDTLLSKSKNTPWLNQVFMGKIVTTYCDGDVTWKAD